MLYQVDVADGVRLTRRPHMTAKGFVSSLEDAHIDEDTALGCTAIYAGKIHPKNLVAIVCDWPIEEVEVYLRGYLGSGKDIEYNFV